MNTSKFQITIILLLTLLQAQAQKPSWIDFNSRKQNFPQGSYLTGFATSKIDKAIPKDEQFLILKGYVKSELVESINVTVSSESLLHSEENFKTATQNYTQTTVSFAHAELPGMKIETWDDKKTKQLYAFSYILTADLCDYYQNKLKEKREKVKSNLLEADQYRKTGNNDIALRIFRDCLPIISEMESDFAIVHALTKQSPQADFQNLSVQVRRGLEEVSIIAASTPQQAAGIIAEAIFAKTKGQKLRLHVLPFTYQDSKMAGEFSSSFMVSLKQKLVEKEITIVEITEANGDLQADGILTGVYWVEAGQLRLIGTVKGKNGIVLAGAEALLSKDWFSADSRSWLPERFEEAGLRMKIFSEGEIVCGGLNLDLWTNKGAENLLYHENDTLKLYTRCNHECYLRFVYYLADGSKILLMNDYYIGSEQVNKVIQIPENFICTEPFGIESLVLNGQTTPFPKLSTTTRNGYVFIENEIQDIVAQSRGFKRLNNEMLNSEKRLIINTLK
jgi:hypothetical protein